MPRSLPEWVGKTPNEKVPARVALRIWDRCGGCCHISGRKIAAGEAWELDHIVALVNGGSHSEGNLAPALKDKHREKTRDDVREKSIAAAKRKKYLGLKPKSSRPMPGSRDSPYKRPFGTNRLVRR